MEICFLHVSPIAFTKAIQLLVHSTSFCRRIPLISLRLMMALLLPMVFPALLVSMVLMASIILTSQRWLLTIKSCDSLPQ